jgi:hypothetical protein
MTAVGPIRLERIHFRCKACGLSGYAFDEPLGLDGLLSKQARRLVCLAGAEHSFAKAHRLLGELCGWSISDEAIRQACYREADRLQQWQEQDESAYQVFLRAAGEIEFQTDAAKVNTLDGWRDMKIGIFAKREKGQPATPAEWDKRDLPKPEARVAFARIEHVEPFGERCREWAARLGIADPGVVSVLGDGAEWIWDLAEMHLPGAAELVDVYHACEHLATAGRTLLGEQTEAFRTWLEQARQRLLADGWWGVCEQAGETLTTLGEPAREAVEKMVGYFSKHTTRLSYCARLYAGQSIGSGMVEGAAKNVIGRRLKQTAACWRLENVQKMAVLCCSAYSQSWPLYWTAA